MQKGTETINKRIARYRGLAGYTQEEAASLLGMNKSTYARMERSGSPKPETLKKLAEIFHVTTDKILYGETALDFNSETNDTAPMRDAGLSPEETGDLTLTINERNCIKICRNLSNKDRTDLVEYINKFVAEHLKEE